MANSTCGTKRGFEDGSSYQVIERRDSHKRMNWLEYAILDRVLEMHGKISSREIVYRYRKYWQGIDIFLPAVRGNRARNIPMQQIQPLADRCQYPDCTNLSAVTCKKCHQGFCIKHVHREWRKYICEFCFLLEQAQGGSQKKARRFAFLVCILLAVGGVVLLILGLNNVVAVVFIVGGITGVGSVASSKQHMLPPPTAASNIDGDAVMNRLFGYRDDE